MTHDYQVVAFQDAATVTRIGLYSATPRTLDIEGQDFHDVVEVLINGVRSPEFVVLSPRRLLAQVPRSQLSAVLESVDVYSARAGSTSKTVINLQSCVPGRVAEGRTKLVQSFLKLLLTTPGTDVFMPSTGGGLYSLVGSTLSAAEIRARATLAVSNTASQLTQYQAEDNRLDASEKLKSATLLSADFDAGTSTLAIRVRLTAVDGSTSDAGLSF